MLSKINTINGVESLNFNNKSTSNNITKPIKRSLRENNTEIIGIPKSYITFKANKKINLIDNENNYKLSDDAEVFVKEAIKLANKYKHSELTPNHFLQILLNETIDSLKSDQPKLTTLIAILNKISNRDLLETTTDLESLISGINNLNYVNTSILSDLNKSDKITNPTFSLKDYKDIDKDGIIKVLDIINTELNNLKDPQIQEILFDFQAIGHFKPIEEIEKNYFDVYDKYAMEVWNKLALGTNLFITSKDSVERDSLISSLYKTINEKKPGNFNSQNTRMSFVDSGTDISELLVSITKQIENAQVNDEKLIYFINLEDLFTDIINSKGEVDLSKSTNLIDLLNLAENDIKFVLLQNGNDNFEFLSDPQIKSLFSNYLNYSLPSLHSYDALNIIKNDEEFYKTISKKFTDEAIEKLVILSEKFEGVFPDKAYSLIDNVSEYFNDVKKIKSKHIDEYAIAARELLQDEDNDNAIIYNTGKTLANYYGKETTKKDIENIVKQIKAGKLKTQGVIITSDDIEAGSGKRFTAKVIAGEAKIPYMEINTSEFGLAAYGDYTQSRILPADKMGKLFKDLKNAAKENQYNTAIMYIDNFEEFVLNSDYNPGHKQALTQLSREMERSLSENINIIVMGGTQKYYADTVPMFIKDFSQKIVVNSPANDTKSRRDILTKLINKKNLHLVCKNKKSYEDLINKLVKLTDGFSYVDIKNLINKTETIIVERNKTRAGIGDFIEAYLQISSGRTTLPMMNSDSKKILASHECGHATNLEVMNNVYNNLGKKWFVLKDVNFITLDPRGNFLGAMFPSYLENTEYPFEAVFSNLVCCYGGYSCEKQFFEMDGSSGISQDLAQATAIAQQAIKYYGLGYYTGKISSKVNILSGEHEQKIYKDLNVILTNAQTASDLITEYYKDFNKKFTNKYSKLIGTDNCMIDGDEFRKNLNSWIATRPQAIKEELQLLDEIIMDIIKYSKNGKIYPKGKKIVI